jgi:N6-L-threonylcarbamoyladenine synthase
VVDTLAEKTRRALRVTQHRRLVVAGGVGANRALRERLTAVAAENGAELYFPRTEFCTDNGAMIALAGCLKMAARAAAGQADARSGSAGTARAAGPGGAGMVDGVDRALALGARARWPLTDDESTGV